jgi:RimJ/RimL family protein N-acetyltransferase
MQGRWCRLERLDAGRHAADLWQADAADVSGASWTYLPYGPWADRAAYAAWVASVQAGRDPHFWAILEPSGRAVGVAAYLRVAPDAGSVEVGHIHLSPALARTTAATEAMYLLMARAFDDLGMRRYEWKCHALNEPSRRAALRLGFTYEGTSRQHDVVKGRNRDTAWFSLLDHEWPAVRAGLQAWLEPANHDARGHQRRRLRQCP